MDVSMKRLHLTIETDMTTLISNFHNLHAEYCGDTPVASGDTIPNREFSCQVETKSLAMFVCSISYPLLQKCLFINDSSHKRCVKLRFVLKEDVTLYGIAPHFSD